VQPVDALLAFGGAARRSQLVGHVSRRRLAAAVRAGAVARHGKAYVLADGDRAVATARALHGVASHRSAARRHGFALPPGDDRHHVTIPPGARRRSVPPDVHLHWSDVPDADRVAGVTNPVLTVVHCLRDLSHRDALSVGDSALRSGKVLHAELAAAVAALRGPRSARARTRFTQLDARAENAFESSCRSLLLEARILGFAPQFVVRHHGQFIGRVDLAHSSLRVVIECDGFGTHGGRDAFVRDLVRFTSLVAAGWRPLRFTWEQVMFQPAWVIDRVRDVVGEPQRTRKTTDRPASGVSTAA
jgi:very-short-patch-repair endonuclease